MNISKEYISTLLVLSSGSHQKLFMFFNWQSFIRMNRIIIASHKICSSNLIRIWDAKIRRKQSLQLAEARLKPWLRKLDLRVASGWSMAAKNHYLHVVGRNGSHKNLSNTGKNLNFLWGTMKISSHDSNWNFSRAIFEQKVEAVVQFIVHHLGIKSADMSRSNVTSRRGNSIESIKSNKPEGCSQRNWQNTLKEGRETNVPDFVPTSIEINDQ